MDKGEMARICTRMEVTDEGVPRGRKGTQRRRKKKKRGKIVTRKEVALRKEEQKKEKKEEELRISAK